MNPKFLLSFLGTRYKKFPPFITDTGEQGLEICEALVRSGAIDVVVVDSVAALTPRAEIEGDMGDSHVGLLARLMPYLNSDNPTLSIRVFVD